MLSQKGNVVILILLLVSLLSIFLIALKLKFYFPTQSLSNISLLNQNKDLMGLINEDQLSLYTIPSDVLAALNLAKTEGRPVLGIRADGPTYHIPILIYHYVEHVQDSGDKIRISLNTLPEVLDKQIETLVQAGYSFITASELADILDGIKPAPSKPVMLTFDDGYRDFYIDAFPILKKYNVKAVNYVVSGFINLPNNLTDAQLKEIVESGLVEIGAHTVHHLALAGLSDSQLAFEVGQSKIQLEQHLGFPITAFAYPYGSFDIHAIQSVKQAGFRTAVSTLSGAQLSNSVRFFVSRLRPGGNTGQSLLNLLQNN
ncbi:polysaccharide deacetylase family protein [Candidatus Daviesbacteria bacterium]|nr:polysaccharide deacetylase family protein [Candidatus Daviesbacteria bacterium]